MLRFLVNTEMLFTETPWLERCRKAAEAGFRAVEIWVPYRVEVEELARAATRAGVELIQFNMAVGDMAKGERGMLALPSRRDEFRAAFRRDLETGKRLGVRQFNCPCGNRVPAYSDDEHLACMRDNLEWAAPQLQTAGLRVNIEPLNSFQNPLYLMPRAVPLFGLLREWKVPNVGVQLDLFHSQLMEGNLVNTLRANLDLIGHIQVADAPDRHEPGTGEINYRFVFRELDKMEYKGFVSLEYAPSGATEESLRWLPRACRVEASPEQLAL